MDLGVVTPFPPRLTGIGQYGYHLCRALARSGAFDRVVVLAEGGPPAGGLEAGVLVEWRCWPYGHPAVGVRLLAALTRARPQVVWVNFGFSMFGPSPAALLSGLLGLTVASLRGMSMVITLHEPGLLEVPLPADLGVCPLSQAALRRLAGWVARLGVLAVPLRTAADRLHRRFPGATVVYLPHGTFDPPEALPEPLTPNVLFFGFIAPYKGLQTLVRAFEQLRPANPTLTLEVAGADHPRFSEYGLRLRRTLGAVPGLRWTGPVPEGGLRELFRRSTLLVLPYRASLGASSVLYRAAAWGRPVVASDLPALREAATDAGLRVSWVPPGDVESLAETLASLLARPELRTEQARQNMQAISPMTLEAVAEAYGRLLQSPCRKPLPCTVPEWR